MLASLIFDAVMSIPAEQRKKPISVLCTDTRVEIPAIAEMIEGTLDRMRKSSQQHSLNIDANHVAPGFSPAPNVLGNRICEGWRSDEPGGAGLKPGATIKESFWVNIIGRGYPPPNRTFRWCTQRMKIDPVNALVQQRVGHWGEAILHSWPVLRVTKEALRFMVALRFPPRRISRKASGGVLLSSARQQEFFYALC